MTCSNDKVLRDLAEILGAKYVLTGTDADPWRKDWTRQYKGDPLAVVRPASTHEVSEVMKLAYHYEVPVVPVGGNTGLTGGAIGEASILLCLDRLKAIRDINPRSRVATVEAGVIVDKLDQAVEPHGLTFPLRFGASGSAQVGGILSTNAGGANVLRYGNARDLCLGVEVVLADGRIMNLLSSLRKNNTGFDLRHLVIGAEGLLGIVTAASLVLHTRPTHHVTAMIGMETLDHVPMLLNALQDISGGAVEAFEFMTRSYIDLHCEIDTSAREPFDAPHEVNLLVELASVGDRVSQEMLETVLGEAMEASHVADAVIAQNETQRSDMWARREAGAEVCFHHPFAIDTDIAVPLGCIAQFMQDISPRLKKIDPDCFTLAVGHLGDGNLHYAVHPSITNLEHLTALRAAIDAYAVTLGGTFSAEHGIGQTKISGMAKRKDPVALLAMRAIKQGLDPKGILNPGKLLPQFPIS